MGTIHDRIGSLVEQYGEGKNTVFAKLLGENEANIRGYRANIIPKHPFLEKIVKTFDVSAEWLLTGDGGMLRSTPQVSNIEIEERFPLQTDRKVAIQNIPLYELDATAGLTALFADNRQIPISHLQIPDLPPCDGALYVRGDSMYPLLKSGDIVLYKEICNIADSILWGEMYLLSFCLDGDEYITIKYIQRGDSPDQVRLVSHNPNHSPKDIPLSCIRALALIKASVRFNTLG